MKKSINKKAMVIQQRFFDALNIMIASGESAGLKDFCDKHNFNRTKYSRIRSTMHKSMDEMKYKVIDIDALACICEDFGISCDWLLLGKGNMLKTDDYVHSKKD